MPEKKLKELTPAEFAFLTWLYRTHPNIAQAAESHQKSLNGFFDSLSNVFNSVMEKAPELMNQYVASKEQIAQLKLNIARAKAGQYPISEGSGVVAAAQAPQVVPTWAVVLGVGGALALLYLLVRK